MINDLTFVERYREAMHALSFCIGQKAYADSLVNLGKIVSNDLTDYMTKNSFNFTLFKDYSDYCNQWSSYHDLHLRHVYSGFYTHALLWSRELCKENTKKFLLIVKITPIYSTTSLMIVFGNVQNDIKCCLDDAWVKDFDTLEKSVK